MQPSMNKFQEIFEKTSALKTENPDLYRVVMLNSMPHMQGLIMATESLYMTSLSIVTDSKVTKEHANRWFKDTPDVPKEFGTLYDRYMADPQSLDEKEKCELRAMLFFMFVNLDRRPKGMYTEIEFMAAVLDMPTDKTSELFEKAVEMGLAAAPPKPDASNLN